MDNLDRYQIEYLHERVEKLEKSSGLVEIENKIMNFCFVLISVSMSVFLIGLLVLSAIKILS